MMRSSYILLLILYVDKKEDEFHAVAKVYQRIITRQLMLVPKVPSTDHPKINFTK